MLDLYVEFEAAIETLEHEQVNYALCGGLAVAFFTLPRFTQDIDILIAPEETERGKAILLPLGFKFFSTPMRFDKDAVEVHRLTKIEQSSGDHLFLDLIAAISPETRSILAARIRSTWNEKPIWVVSRAGLIELKKTANRPKDLLDLDALQESAQ